MVQNGPPQKRKRTNYHLMEWKGANRANTNWAAPFARKMAMVPVVAGVVAQ
jgi:hypothetical protein